MKIATLVKELDGFTGTARLYRVEPPTQYNTYDDNDEQVSRSTEFVVVSAANAMFSGPETYIFPANVDGDVIDWLELEGSFKGALDHEKALSRAGYTIQ